MTKGKKLAKISRLSTEWSLSFDFRLLEHNRPNDKFTNILIISPTPGVDHILNRYPSFYVYDQSKLHISLAAPGNSPQPQIGFSSDHIKLNETIKIEVDHLYAGNGYYKYSISLDCELKLVKIYNNAVMQQYDVTIAAGGSFQNAPKAYISNFKHTNFY